MVRSTDTGHPETFPRAKGVYIMIPPNMTSAYVHVFQKSCTATGPTGSASEPYSLSSAQAEGCQADLDKRWTAIGFKRVGQAFMKYLKLQSILTTIFAILLLFCWFVRPAQADEGMWTFNNFPSQKVQAKYGYVPSQSWLDHVRESSLRIA
jgi:hypothetical protein